MRNFFLLAFCFTIFSIGNAFTQQQEINQWLLKLSEAKTNDSASAYILTRLSNYSQVDNLKRAIAYADRAIETSKRVELIYPSLLAEAYNQQASNFSWKNNYDTALQLYLKAIEIVNRYGIKNELSYIFTGVADVYTETGSVDKALSYSRRAMNISLEEDDPKQLMYAYHSMAGVYRNLNNYSEAEKYTRKALTLFRTYNNKDRVATCYMDIAKLYAIAGDNSRAISVLDSAVTIFTLLEEPIQIAEADELYGSIYNSRKDFVRAEDYFNRALKIYSNDSLSEDEYRVYMGLAQCQYLQKNYKEANRLLAEADNWFRENDSDEMHLQCLLFLAKTDSALGITKNAFSYMEEYRQLSERVSHKKQELQARQMLIEYDVADKEKENLRLKQQNAIAREEIIISTIAGVLLLFAFGVTLFMYLQKKKINAQLILWQKQTEDINRQLEQSNNVKNQLFSILAHDLRSPMTNMLHLLQITKKGEVSYEQFRQISDMLEADLIYNNQLLENMLNWAKSQMDGIILYKKKLKLEPLIAENIHLFESVAARKKVKINCHVPSNTEVIADENILRLALRNAVSNAIKFSTHDKSINITIAEQGDKMLLQVRDNGIGMTQQQLDKLYTLHISSTTGTEKEKGAGLGLKITKEMMDKMEAPFWIESIEREGTTVNMLLQKG